MAGVESGLPDDGATAEVLLPDRTTEQSYLVWIERFARHLGTEDLAAQGEAQIAAFLDGMALNERLSASSQRQALTPMSCKSLGWE